jgi:hypothetical protein
MAEEKIVRNYTWGYGIFHWFLHYVLTWLVVILSGVHIFPIVLPLDLFGTVFLVNYVDIFLGCVITTLIDADHLAVVFKLGFKRVVFAQKRLVEPFHNFFFLSLFSIITAIIALFISKEVAALIFLIPLHMIWDIIEDVFIFKTSFRRWEKTWGLSTKDLEDAYNELMQMPPEPKKESRIKKVGSKLRERGSKIRERIRTKKLL